MLPRVDTPSYSILLPSTGQEVRIRPYTVKQEKTLLIALESKSFDQILESILTVVDDCVTSENVNVRVLPSFDLEALFIAIRSKSVGEGVQLRLKCESCEAPNDLSLDLNNHRLSSQPVKDNKIEVTPTIGFVTKYPSLVDLKGIITDDKAAIDQIIGIAAKCIDYVYDETQVYKSNETSFEELVAFVESLSSQQFNELKIFVEGIPKITKDVSFVCTGCKHQNNLTLEGLQSFFT